jgi:hypothetical protein
MTEGSSLPPWIMPSQAITARPSQSQFGLLGQDLHASLNRLAARTPHQIVEGLRLPLATRRELSDQMARLNPVEQRQLATTVALLQLERFEPNVGVQLLEDVSRVPVAKAHHIAQVIAELNGRSRVNVESIPAAFNALAPLDENRREAVKEGCAWGPDGVLEGLASLPRDRVPDARLYHLGNAARMANVWGAPAPTVAQFIRDLAALPQAHAERVATALHPLLHRSFGPYNHNFLAPAQLGEMMEIVKADPVSTGSALLAASQKYPWEKAIEECRPLEKCFSPGLVKAFMAPGVSGSVLRQALQRCDLRTIPTDALGELAEALVASGSRGNELIALGGHVKWVFEAYDVVTGTEATKPMVARYLGQIPARRRQNEAGFIIDAMTDDHANWMREFRADEMPALLDRLSRERLGREPTWRRPAATPPAPAATISARAAPTAASSAATRAAATSRGPSAADLDARFMEQFLAQERHAQEWGGYDAVLASHAPQQQRPPVAQRPVTFADIRDEIEDAHEEQESWPPFATEAAPVPSRPAAQPAALEAIDAGRISDNARARGNGRYEAIENTMDHDRGGYVASALQTLASRCTRYTESSCLTSLKSYLTSMNTDQGKWGQALRKHRELWKPDPQRPGRKISAGPMRTSELENALCAFDGPAPAAGGYGSLMSEPVLRKPFAQAWHLIEQETDAGKKAEMKFDLASVLAQGIADDGHCNCGVGMKARFVTKMGTHWSWLGAPLSTPGDLMRVIGGKIYELAEEPGKIEARQFHDWAMQRAREAYPTPEELTAAEAAGRHDLVPLGAPSLVREFQTMLEGYLDGESDYRGWRNIPTSDSRNL